MIFKFALKSDSEHIIAAVWIIVAAALLPVSLGVYVYPDSKAKGMLIDNRDKRKIGLTSGNTNVIRATYNFFVR
jgi:hypothetical protein